MRLAVAAMMLAPLMAGAAGVEECRALRHRGRISEAHECFAGLAEGRDAYLRAEGFWGLQRYEEANTEFQAAVKEHPENAEYRVRWGRLLLERFNRQDAAALFQEALDRDPKNAGGYVGLALVASENFDTKAVEFAAKAAELDPKLVEARELLAYLALEDGDEAKAKEEADQALKISADALDAMAIRATIVWMKEELLTGDIQSPWMDRILLANPVYGEAYSTAAHFFVLNRRYAEGIRLYEKAIALNPRLWEARAQLGVNLMRLARGDEARAQLTLTYDNGYRNAETVNALRLLDSYRNFDLIKDGGAVLMLNKKEEELLRPYFGELANRAMKAYESKYHYHLPGTVRIEAYPDHEDFAVRTMGMPGLGALGVTFGTMVAMDSPSGRPPGQFHWGSTLWHEMSHVYVLTETKHLVPRWYTEGLAVYEESIASPGWGDRITPDDIEAIRKKKLLPVAEMDQGFVRPSYLAQVAVSYYEAGQMCQFIAEKWSYEKLVGMIPAFGARKTTPVVVRENLGVAPEEFDKRFMAWLDERTGKTVAHFDEWKKRARGMAAMLGAGKYDEAIAEGLAIRDYYSDYVESGSVYEMLAKAYLAKGDKKAAMGQLEVYATTGGRNVETLKRLAALEQEAGRPEKAIDALERLIYIYPEDEDVHRKLGELYLAREDNDGAIREFHALLALKPLDQAGSHYELARAYHQAHRPGDAREQVLAALEVAPDYKPAQKLLLELTK